MRLALALRERCLSILLVLCLLGCGEEAGGGGERDRDGGVPRDLAAGDGGPGADLAPPDLGREPDLAADLGAPPPDLARDGGEGDGSARDGGPLADLDAAPGADADSAGDGPVDLATDAGTDGGVVREGTPEVLVEVPLVASAAYLERRAAYLAACATAAAPGQGRSLYGQVCRVAQGLPVDPASVEASLERVGRREDTADFHVAALVRLLLLDRRTGALDEELRLRIEATLLGFKYWLDEPGRDQMCYWSENHQILFHSSELLMGQLFPEARFTNDGRTGREHADHARPLVARWLDLRGRFGFSEWHSNVYFNEDVPALVNLADFADDPAVRTRAAMVLDLLAFDLLGNTFAGHLATVHGRTYPNHTVGGLRDSTREFAWLTTGLGEVGSWTNFSGAFLATSDGYVPAPLLADLATVSRVRHERRQRDGFDVADGPRWGIGYDDPADVVVWAGMVALAAPEVIAGTVALLDQYDLWEGFLFGDLPPLVRTLLESLRDSGGLVELATEVAPVSRGIALQAMSTYTWRTPHYQLSGAQDYHPGSFGAQTHLWQATLDREAYVFTSFSCSTQNLEGAGGLEFGGAWIGCWLPRATFHRNVGVIQYVRPDVPLVEPFLVAPHTHAYFPRAAFDEVWQDGHWFFGRKGKAYVALWSQLPSAWAEGSDHDLVAADGPANTYLVELGSQPEQGSFDRFVEALRQAPVEVVDGRVRFTSPSAGLVEVGWTGPLTVAEVPVDLGPFPRWADRFASQAAGETRTVLDLYGQQLRLDFAHPARQLFRTVSDPPPFDACAPDGPPDRPCHAARRDPGSPQVALARRIAERWIEVHPATTLAWNWEEAVLLRGLVELYRVTGEAVWRDYLRAYLDHHLAQGVRFTSPDNAVPALVALALLEDERAPADQQFVADVRTFLLDTIPRDAAGGINHLGVRDEAGITLWIDSLFMHGSVLTGLGELTGDVRALDELSFQFRLLSERLQDPGGLFRHAHNWILPQDPGVHWARGNGWVTAAGYEYLRVRRARNERDDLLRDLLARQVQALLATQDPATGLWWSVLERPGEIYLETSASALIAWGLARGWRAGYLPDRVLDAVRRAGAGVVDRVRLDEQGRPVVTGTSGPTTAGGFEVYAAVRQEDDLPYGVGAVILLLLESSGLPAAVD